MSKWQCSRHNELDRGGNSRFLGGLRNLHTQEYAETTLRDEASPTPKKDERASKKAGKRCWDALGSSKKLHDTQEGIKQNKQMVLKKKKPVWNGGIVGKVLRIQLRNPAPEEFQERRQGLV